MSTNQQAPSRRDRILASAEAEFAAHGLAGARVERIAAGAAVNKQLLFHYFSSKIGLYQAVSQSVSDRFDLDTPKGTTPVERLRGLVKQLVQATQGHRALLPVQWGSRAIGAAISIIEDGQRSGYFRDDVDPAAVAEVVVAATLGITPNDVAAGQPSGTEARFVESIVRMVVDHCTWR